MTNPTPSPSARRLRVLGIDPGTRIVGWSVVEADGPRLQAVAHGALRASASMPTAERLAQLAGQLREVVKTYAPDEAAMEAAFHGRDARAALAIGEARGAFTVVLVDAGLMPQSYANNVVKKAVCGAGRAGKAQVQAAVRRILALDELPTPFDAADALAVAVCHHQRRGIAALAGGQAPARGTKRARPDQAGRTGGVSPRIAEALRKQGLDPRRIERR